MTWWQTAAAAGSSEHRADQAAVRMMVRSVPGREWSCAAVAAASSASCSCSCAVAVAAAATLALDHLTEAGAAAVDDGSATGAAVD